jgi:hypothetical protein
LTRNNLSPIYPPQWLDFLLILPQSSVLQNHSHPKQHLSHLLLWGLCQDKTHSKYHIFSCEPSQGAELGLTHFEFLRP